MKYSILRWINFIYYSITINIVFKIIMYQSIALQELSQKNFQLISSSF